MPKENEKSITSITVCGPNLLISSPQGNTIRPLLNSKELLYRIKTGNIESPVLFNGEKIIPKLDINLKQTFEERIVEERLNGNRMQLSFDKIYTKFYSIQGIKAILYNNAFYAKRNELPSPEVPVYKKVKHNNTVNGIKTLSYNSDELNSSVEQTFHTEETKEIKEEEIVKSSDSEFDFFIENFDKNLTNSVLEYRIIFNGLEFILVKFENEKGKILKYGSFKNLHLALLSYQQSLLKIEGIKFTTVSYSPPQENIPFSLSQIETKKREALITKFSQIFMESFNGKLFYATQTTYIPPLPWFKEENKQKNPKPIKEAATIQPIKNISYNTNKKGIIMKNDTSFINNVTNKPVNNSISLQNTIKLNTENNSIFNKSNQSKIQESYLTNQKSFSNYNKNYQMNNPQMIYENNFKAQIKPKESPNLNNARKMTDKPITNKRVPRTDFPQGITDPPIKETYMQYTEPKGTPDYIRKPSDAYRSNPMMQRNNMYNKYPSVPYHNRNPSFIPNINYNELNYKPMYYNPYKNEERPLMTEQEYYQNKRNYEIQMNNYYNNINYNMTPHNYINNQRKRSTPNINHDYIYNPEYMHPDYLKQQEMMNYQYYNPNRMNDPRIRNYENEELRIRRMQEHQRKMEEERKMTEQRMLHEQRMINDRKRMEEEKRYSSVSKTSFNNPYSNISRITNNDLLKNTNLQSNERKIFNNNPNINNSFNNNPNINNISNNPIINPISNNPNVSNNISNINHNPNININNNNNISNINNNNNIINPNISNNNVIFPIGSGYPTELYKSSEKQKNHSEEKEEIKVKKINYSEELRKEEIRKEELRKEKNKRRHEEKLEEIIALEEIKREGEMKKKKDQSEDEVYDTLPDIF